MIVLIGQMLDTQGCTFLFILRIAVSIFERFLYSHFQMDFSVIDFYVFRYYKVDNI